MGLKEISTRAKLRVERARADHMAMDVGVRTLRRYSEDTGGMLAAALTYYTFFSIFPLLLFTASAIGYLSFFSESFKENLLRSGLENVPLLSRVLTYDVLEALKEQRGTLALVGLLLALYSGTGAVVALGHALNRINRVPDDATFLQKRLGSLKWLGILGGAGIVSVAASALVQGIGDLLGTSTVGGVLLSSLLFVVSVAINTAIFMTAYRFLTRALQSWRDVLPGALIAATAFELLKFFGGTYLGAGAGGRSETFGAFSAAAGLLVASYLLAQITLLAAEVNAVLAERSERRTSRIETSPDGR